MWSSAVMYELDGTWTFCPCCARAGFLKHICLLCRFWHAAEAVPMHPSHSFWSLCRTARTEGQLKTEENTCRYGCWFFMFTSSLLFHLLRNHFPKTLDHTTQLEKKASLPTMVMTADGVWNLSHDFLGWNSGLKLTKLTVLAHFFCGTYICMCAYSCMFCTIFFHSIYNYFHVRFWCLCLFILCVKNILHQ